MMDLRTLVCVSSLLLTAEANHTAMDTQTVTPPSSSDNNCSCLPPVRPALPSLPSPSSPSSSTPVLGLLTVNWTLRCRGVLSLTPYVSSSGSVLPVCFSHYSPVPRLLNDVCVSRKGCEGKTRWAGSNEEKTGYNVTERGAEERSSCETLIVTCKAAEQPPDVGGQLQAYKVVTALLCCVLLILLLIRFTRPTVRVLQKRLSDRRQSRWIGPTQSHSVSYHRGKSAVSSVDGEKRLSYPALERLTVRDSRDASATRNSDCNY